MNPESKRPISIEDLLRVKRAERPPAEFWTEFDRQLRAKQLSALVAKRPWWQRVPRIFAGTSRFHLPLGATAILAVSFVSIRSFHSGPALNNDRVESGPRADAVALSSPSIIANQGGASDGIAAEHVVIDRSIGDTVSAPADSVRPAASNSAAAAVQERSGMISLLGTGGGLASVSAGDSALYAGSSLTVAQDEMPGTRSLLGPSRAFESRAQTARTTVEPLQQITPPSERSRAKLLTAMLSMTSPEATVRPTDRAASKLSEERLYDQIHRFDTRGTTVRMKF